MTDMQSVKSLNLEQVNDIYALVEQAALKWGDKTGFIFDEFDIHLTFEEIHRKTNQIANYLLKIGINKGDRVGLMIKNRPEFPLIWLALGKIGAIMIPINVFYKRFDAKYLLEHSEAKLVFTSNEFIPMLQEIIEDEHFDVETEIISIDQEEMPGVPNLYEELKEVSFESPNVKLFPEDLMNIQYTSGTTGRPKGCMLSHSYWITMGINCLNLASPKLNETDIMLTAQPFYYIDPQWNVITSLMSGATLVVLDRFHPSTFWDKVREYDVTFFYCLGVMPVLMLKMPESPEDRNNKVRQISCSAIPTHLHKTLEERWGAPWSEVFGMTETGIDITVRSEEHDELIGTGCIGSPNPHREVRIVDENDEILPRGEVGELVMRGTGMMQGYYKDPESTQKAFRNGFFHTGDLAYMDEDGRIYYVGRLKEMIRRSGENISATEVEDALKLFPEVNYAAAVPVPDEIRGEEVKAYVVLKPDARKPEELIDELLEFAHNHLAYFKVPRYWEFRDSLPKTPSEKIAKHKLIQEKEDLRLNSYDAVEKIWR